MRYATVAWLALVCLLGGCWTANLTYEDPEAGALRLIRNPASTSEVAVLDFVVGDLPLTGYAAGFNLPLDPDAVTLAGFTPGSGLDPGSPPLAAHAVIATEGALAGTLMTVQSQKASGAGAVASDAVLAPGTVLYTVRLALVHDGFKGVVFDGTAGGFVLPSGGLRSKAGLTVVEPQAVAIGKLEVR
jgi:hypothetical protein